jgi:two-component system, sensor histidine kinase and response regulator
MQENTEVIFDPTFLIEQCGDTEFMIELVEEFVASLPDTKVRLAKLIADLEYDAAHEEAHTVKGTAANLTAHQLSAAALSLEKASRNSDPEALNSAMEEFLDQCNVFESRFEKEREKLLP